MRGSHRSRRALRTPPLPTVAAPRLATLCFANLGGSCRSAGFFSRVVVLAPYGRRHNDTLFGFRLSARVSKTRGFAARFCHTRLSPARGKLTPRRRLRAVALHYSRSAMKAALARGSWSYALVAASNIVRLAIATLPPISRCAHDLRWAPFVSLLRTAPPALATLGEVGCSQWLRHQLHIFCRLPHKTGAANITPAAPSVTSPRFARSAQFPHPPPPRSRLRHCLSQSLPGSVALSRYYACSAPSTARWLRSLPWLPSRL